MKILIVDDKPENLYLLELILKGSGYNSVSARNGTEALEVIQKNIPDLIITDILMPVMDGFTLCRELKKNDQLCKIPLIFYTATYTDPKDEEFALGLGADRFVLKPKEPDEFMKIIEEVLHDVKNRSDQESSLPSLSDELVLKEYNEALVRKLEDKMLQAEQAERRVTKYNIALLREIEERKQAEELLRKSERQIKLIYDTVGDSIFNLKVEKGGKYIFTTVNKQFLKTTGLKAEQIIGKSAHEIIPEPSLSLVLEKYAQAIRERKLVRWEETSRYPSGELIGEVSIAPIFDDNLNCTSLVGSVHDITERKRTEEELSMLAHSLRSINECVSITDMDDEIIFVNSSFLNTYGYEENELIGKHMSIVRSQNNPNEIVSEILPATLKGGWSGEIFNKKKDGTEFPIFLSTTIIRDTSGVPIALIGVASDITARKQAEKELIEAKDKAERSDRLKTEFFAQMSHEVRTPISVINGNVGYLSELFGDTMDKDVQSCFDGISLASQRIIRTMELILNYSELQTIGYKPDLTEIDLGNDILTPLISEYKQSAEKKNLKFHFINKLGKHKIQADDYSIRQIFANLIDNAIKYTLVGEVEILIDKNQSGNKFVQIKDTGVGMRPEFLSKIYEPFVQEEQGYSRSFDGNGLGLALVKKYCSLNNAAIEVTSKKNVGSSFRVTFSAN